MANNKPAEAEGAKADDTPPVEEQGVKTVVADDVPPAPELATEDDFIAEYHAINAATEKSGFVTAGQAARIKHIRQQVPAEKLEPKKTAKSKKSADA